jgi:hypothetical protein
MSSGDYLKDIDNVRNEAIKRERMVNHNDNLTGLELAKIAMALDHLKKENEQLKEALRKCSPVDEIHGEFAEDITYKCKFCGSGDHKPDCEYVRLTE